MSTYYEDETVTLHHGDCIDVLRAMPDVSVDSIVTDPPYGLGFMGKAWDDLPPGLPWALECLRVLKPGGHLLAFGGTRTSHRLAVAIEDAGFEIRDSIAWLYGSGFPKSLDVSKAIDKVQGARREACSSFAPDAWAPEVEDRDVCTTCFYRATDHVGFGDHVGTVDFGMKNRCAKCGLPFFSGNPCKCPKAAPATPDAQRWQGWGTALKPAHEPVVVARKPLAGTVAQTVLAHGTGALNVDGCRVGTETRTNGGMTSLGVMHDDDWRPREVSSTVAGRWPANVILDESQAGVLDEMSGEQRDGIAVNRNRFGDKPHEVYGGGWGTTNDDEGYGGTGGASRFFYVAKADAGERVRVDGIAHPTVKPLALMRWLTRLVTPPGGTVLEPFAGSGTTVEACILEGFRCVAIEREADYLPLIVQRINRRRDPVAAVMATGDDGGLFDLLDGGAA